MTKQNLYKLIMSKWFAILSAIVIGIWLVSRLVGNVEANTEFRKEFPDAEWLKLKFTTQEETALERHNETLRRLEAIEDKI